MDDRFDDLIESADMKLKAGAPLSKDEANAWMALGLFNPTNQVYFRAGLIACREYMARFVEAQSPEIAASIRANWWPKLGPDFGPPRLMHWNELVKDGRDEPPIECRDDISPTLEALPIALQFLETPEPAPRGEPEVSMTMLAVDKAEANRVYAEATSGVTRLDGETFSTSDADGGVR